MHFTIKNIFYYLLGALLILAYALYNGYPIIYHDLSTYVANGFDLQTPIDRPITYCLFVRVFSLNGFSLWPVIFAQSYILSYLIFKLLWILFEGLSQWYILFVISFLSLFTGLSWTASQVMPDIFTAISVIIVVILFIGHLKPNEKYFMYFLFLLSTAMHLSHITFNLALISILLFSRLFKNKFRWKTANYQNYLIMFILTVFAFLSMMSAAAKSKHVFFMGAMAEHGILKIFLDDNCEYTNYELCKYKDDLPKRAYQFVWDENSPVYKMGSWQASKDEFDKIIFKTLTTPKYIFLHIKESIKATFDQLVTFRINDSNGVFLEGSMPYDRIVRYIPGDLNGYLSSKQMRNEFGFTDLLNKIFTMIVIISLVVIVIFLFNGRIYNGDLAITLKIVILGILLNAWVSGTFANAINRLGCKMIWLIPFLATIGLIQLLRNRNEITNPAK